MAYIAELAHGEKSHTQSLNHSPSLFHAPGTKASEQQMKITTERTSSDNR